MLNFILSEEIIECFWRFPAGHPLLKRENAMILQSETVDGPVLEEEKSVSVTQQETIQFVDAGLPETDNYHTDFEPTYSEQTDEIATLGKFLERPVLINQHVWLETDVFTLTPATFTPWYDYFNNQFIKAKLSNFARIHCNLKLTFRFNASPFYYGALRVFYDPLSTGKFVPISTEDIVSLSQTPGVMLEPQVTSVAEMELPFLWPNTWLDTGEKFYFQQMGTIGYQVFAPLRSANGVVGTGITVSVYASACDVQIAGPTTKLLLQSGLISGPASAVARVAKSLSTTSGIAPYARAVDIGASAVAGIAKIFGFSNPPVVSDVQPFQNKVFHAFANTETSVPIDKLAIDPHNEVTIDNRVAGSDASDPLVIQALVTRPAILTPVTLTAADVAGTILTKGTVTPYIVRTTTDVHQKYSFHSPSGWVAANFRYWRGGMKYTFRVIRSKYHKGRLIFSWDPNQALTTTGVETAVFSKIFDLASPDQEFSVEIPYKAYSPWLQCKATSAIDILNVSVDLTAENGHFLLGVLNPLTGPTATSTVTILCSAQAMDDMEFAAPRALPINTSVFSVQSEVMDGSSLEYSKKIPEITVGERIASLRPILHRTTRAMTQYLGATGPDTVVYPKGTYHTVNCFDRLPPRYGYQVNGDSYAWAPSVLAGPTTAFNYCTTHPINWVLAAFAGYRGATVMHASVTTNQYPESMNTMSLTRTDHNFCDINAPDNTVRNVAYSTTQLGCPASLMKTVLATSSGLIKIPLWITGNGGTTVTNGKTQMAMSAVIPQYQRVRFIPSWERVTMADGSEHFDGVRLDTDFSIYSEIDKTFSWPHADIYWAAGVDFNPVFFTGVPHMFTYVPPTPIVVNV